MDANRSRRSGLIAGFATFVTLAGCGPDGGVAPGPRAAQPRAPSTNIENLTSAPILYDQRSSVYDYYDLEGFLHPDVPSDLALDFTVPEGRYWTITQFVMTAHLIEGAPLPGAVTIRPNNDGIPSFDLVAFSTLGFSGSDLNSIVKSDNPADPTLSDYLFTLTNPVTLAAGTYWFSIRVSPGHLIWQRTPVVGNTAWAIPEFAWNTTRDFAFVLFGSSKQTQTITFPAISPDPATAGGTATLGATASSGLAVSYSSKTPAACTVSGNSVSYVGGGVCTVAANQAGSGTYLAAAEATQSVTVVYNFSGFASPVAAPPTVNSVKAGSAVPVKFGLGGDQGLAILAAGSPTSKPMTCSASTAVTTITESATSSAGGSALSYDPATDTYTFVWKTQKSWAETCRTLVVELTDGVEHTADFRFTK